jgi:hypothetical protein
MTRALVFALSFAALASAAPATTIVTSPPSAVPFSAGWPARDCGIFRIAAPDATRLHRLGRFAGVLADRRFVLSYSVGAAVNETIAQAGLDFREVTVAVDGRPALLRTAEFPGEEAPYFLQLVVPGAVKTRHGWVALEIHGWFANQDRRWLAQHVVTSIDFERDRMARSVPPRARPLVLEAP